MSDIDTAAPAGGGDENIPSLPVSTPAETDNRPVDLSEAARQLAAWRHKRANPDEGAAPDAGASEPAAGAQTDTAPKADDAAPQTTEAPGEATETPVDPAAEELSPIDPPRSWTADDKEIFKTLPRETQQKLADRDRARETEFRRGQNEAAELRRQMDAERGEVQQARARYEQALPALLQTLQEQQRGEFADVRTMADVERLAREDWPRYALWDAAQKKIAAVAQEVQAAQHRQVQEYQSQWNSYATRQDQLLLDRVPDLSDKTKAQKLADAAAAVYRDVGFKDEELQALWSGQASISLRDARLSQIVIDAARWREAKASAAKAARPGLPPVQRPGVSSPRPDAASAEIQALEKKFEQTGSLRDAHALRMAQRAQQRSRQG